MRKTVIRNGKKYLVTVPNTDPFCDGGGYYGGGSFNFGAVNQFLSIAGGTDFVIGQNSFTVEWFEYRTFQNSFSRVFTQVAWPNAELGVSIENASPNANFYLWEDGLGNTPATANSGSISAPYLNVWNHYAVCRQSGSYIQIFRNGTPLRTMTGSTHPYITASISSSAPLIIGGEGDNVVNTRMSGSISNFRFVNGYALYSGSFTVPMSPLPAVAGTVLLLTGIDSTNPFLDYSGTNKTVTRNSVSWSFAGPY